MIILLLPFIVFSVDNEAKEKINNLERKMTELQFISEKIFDN